MKKTRTIKVGGYSRTKTTEYDPNNYSKKGVMAGVVYKDKNKPIKKKVTVTTETPRKTKIKTIKYSPINYYGKQTKTKTKKVIKK